MADATWKRHASPWSVWTRAATLPFLALAVWSRVWLGWYALVPVGGVAFWLWINPRLFPPPKSTDNWGSKATFGERVWLNRKSIPVPRHHQVAINWLLTIATLGTIAMVYGLIWLDFWPTVLGVAVTYLGKMWFLDRMVWLYEDMRPKNPEYASWLHNQPLKNLNIHPEEIPS
ncbi:MAG: hypothetical protein RLY93_10625 [Sumerlaeia bacterium]